jgi:hypothetical protein
VSAITVGRQRSHNYRLLAELRAAGHSYGAITKATGATKETIRTAARHAGLLSGTPQTEFDAEEAERRNAAGESQRVLAAEYGVSPASVSRAILAVRAKMEPPRVEVRKVRNLIEIAEIHAFDTADTTWLVETAANLSKKDLRLLGELFG